MTCSQCGYANRVPMGQCARCGGMIDTDNCEHCEDGFDGHDCGEDCCACYMPEDNVPCQYCDGSGLWRRCMNSSAFCQAHPLPGRENVARNTVEWFTTVAVD